MLCKATTQPTWFRPKPRHCLNPAQENGYCKRHDPRRHYFVLLRRKQRLADQVQKTHLEIVELRQQFPDWQKWEKEKWPVDKPGGL